MTRYVVGLGTQLVLVDADDGNRARSIVAEHVAAAGRTPPGPAS